MARSHPAGPAGAPSWWRSRTGAAVIGLALVGAFYVLREHWEHAPAALPYLLILACPLMHLFMHGGHHRHGGGPEAGQGAAPRD